MQPVKSGFTGAIYVRQASSDQIADLVFMSRVSVREDEPADLLTGATFQTLALQASLLRYSIGAILCALAPRQKPTSVGYTSRLGRRVHS